MPEVHNFAIVTQVFDDTRIPTQFPGNGAGALARQFTAQTLKNYIAENVGPQSIENAVSISTFSYTIPSGKWLAAFAIVSGGSASTFDVGTSPGGTNIVEDGEVGANQSASFPLLIYGDNSDITLYWSNLTGTNTIILLLI